MAICPDHLERVQDSLLKKEESPEWAFLHARDVIKGRWPEAEKTIIKSPTWAYLYARAVIKGRWPEAEETISKSSAWFGYGGRHIQELYITEVIKGQRSAILESIYLNNALRCKLSTVREYLSRIDWSDPANDFPIPKRLKYALKSTLKKAKA